MSTAATSAARSSRWPSYGLVKKASFCHSAIYAGLLLFWLIPERQGVQAFFGWGHGLGWFAMVGLSLAGLRARTLPFGLAALVSIGGAVGPFIGSAAFVIRDTRRARLPSEPHGYRNDR